MEPHRVIEGRGADVVRRPFDAVQARRRCRPGSGPRRRSARRPAAADHRAAGRSPASRSAIGGGPRALSIAGTRRRSKGQVRPGRVPCRRRRWRPAAIVLVGSESGGRASGHRRLVVDPVLRELERGGQREDRLAVLHRDHPPGRERAAIADPVDGVEDRDGGSPARMKYECSECTAVRSTVRPAAISAWPATWPPKTRSTVCTRGCCRGRCPSRSTRGRADRTSPSAKPGHRRPHRARPPRSAV